MLNADLTDALFDETTVLPDGESSHVTNVCLKGCWTPDTDLARFTDPEHPDFWNPCVWLVGRLVRPDYCPDSGE